MVTSRVRQRGVTYLWMLFLVFVLGLGLGKSLDVYSFTQQRVKESELLYVGDMYRRAIQAYYQSSPGGQRRYPARLEDLLLEARFITVKRHLRRLYLDPVSGRPFLPLEAPDGGIWGVASPSEKAPIKVTGFAEAYAGFSEARSYRDWQFVYAGR